MARATTPPATPHITTDLLREVVAGDRDPSELVQRGLAHIRALCPACDADFTTALPRLRAEAATPAADPDPDPNSGAAAAGTTPSLTARLEADLARAQQDLARLLAIRDPDERTELIRSRHRRMRSPALVEGLLTEARGWLGHDPQESLHLVEAAALVATRIPEDPFGRERGHLLRLRAEAHRANVLRVLGELRAADSAWRTIRARLDRHPLGAVDERAELASLEASLRMDLRQFDQATELLEVAEGIYREIEDVVGVAKVLMKRGKVAFLLGAPAEDLALLTAAAEHLRNVNEPQLVLTVQHNRADSLIELGRAAEAAGIINVQGELSEKYNDPDLRARREWLQGRIARVRELFTHAETHFQIARNGYLDRGLAYDAGLVSVDLADLYLAWDRPAEARRLAELMFPIFQSQRVHREAIAALIVFQQAAKDELLTAAYLAELRRYLLLGRNDREYRFEGAAELLRRPGHAAETPPRRPAQRTATTARPENEGGD
jgi:tetratricopeptide (TPR) repeat protein